MLVGDKPSSALHLAVCVVGIVASLLVYGVLQERIMTQVRRSLWHITLSLVRTREWRAKPTGVRVLTWSTRDDSPMERARSSSNTPCSWC